MNGRKTLQELTIKDNFMFAAVMLQENNCRTFLEMLLGFPIERVETSYERNILYHPEYKGVRLDVFARDENHTHYNIEMQMVQQKLERRSRYYHSQMDMEMISSGASYEELSDVYVIFICDFDPFGDKKYCYTFNKICQENDHIYLKDGEHSIFLSTKGENPDEVPATMVKFLKYVKAGLEESEKDFEDDFVSNLQKTVLRIKADREMKERYMVLEEMLRDERTEGKAEGKIEDILNILEEIGTIPENVRSQIMSENNLSELNRLLKAAARAISIEEFIEALNNQ